MSDAEEGSKDELNRHPHDEGDPEQYAGAFIRDPWDTDEEEGNDGGELDSGPVPGIPS